MQEGEDPTKMASREETKRIIDPYITHPGSRYGLHASVRYPEDCIDVRRSRPFHFVARSCNKWAMGRVILAGDAAHVFPPFGGQGIASGFRDASALAWRLAHLYREPKANYVEVLRGWYTERKQQFDRSLATTIRNGEFVTNARPWQAFLRDWVFWILQLSPTIKRHLSRGPRNDGMIKYKAGPGLPFIGELGGGLNVPQVYARDLFSGKLSFTDDFIYDPSKKSLFQLLVLSATIQDGLRALEQVQGMSQRTEGRIREGEATVLIHDTNAQSGDTKSQQASILRIATEDEFAASELCRGRPAPNDYDAFVLWKEIGKSAVFVVLRQDRYVYAACSTVEDLWQSLSKLKELLYVL